ncbi:MAG TPA: UDP-N-acetylmuramate--L-alanine ligase [Candidatus Krumholzibacteria bacterium]|nr:UDP-N-acetylmuramate--L-alanine ligase [Candidatus Krumholzibacteria bacterium]
MFRNTRHVHLVAIGGIGMSGIAEILLNLGFQVSGSDLHAGEATERLERLGARIHIGHAPEQIQGADVVVRSSAVTPANPEVQAARRQGIPVIRRAEMLAELMRLKYGIAVAGSHGKTTTTSLCAAVLAAGGLDPTVVVGGRALATGANAILGRGEYMVAEADESDGTFTSLVPTVAVVTNLDLEHVDFYPDLPALRDAFRRFLARVPFYGACVLCADDPEVRALASSLDRKVITYGLSADADVRGEPLDAVGRRARVFMHDREVGELSLGIAGLHNLTNALGAVAVGMELGVPFGPAADALAAFSGVGRRYEDHGVHGGVRVVDDYGHHPTEVAAVLALARAEAGDGNVRVLFQPHRYSRTQRFAEEFADVLTGADAVALLPVYAAGETAPAGVGSGLIADGLARRGAELVTLLDGPHDVPGWIEAAVSSGDLLLTLGAGDVGRLAPRLARLLDGEPDAWPAKA